MERKLNLFIFSLLLTAVILANVCYSQEKSINKQEKSPVLSLKANALLNEPWGSRSFFNAMSLVVDKTENIDSRIISMQYIKSNRLKLSTQEIKTCLNEITQIVNDEINSSLLSKQAIQLIGSLTLILEEMGQLSAKEISEKVVLLIDLVNNKLADVNIRSAAIKSLGVIKAKGAVSTIQSVINLKDNLNNVEITKAACLALLRIEKENALSVLSDVLNETKNISVFETVVYSLGQINSRESFRLLVKARDRFPNSGILDAVFVHLEEVVLEILRNTNDVLLNDAIIATKFLWKEKQKEKYKPLLLNIIKTASADTKEKALIRLLEEAQKLDLEQEKKELSTVYSLIENQNQFNSYKETIEKRLAAKIISPIQDNAMPIRLKENWEK